jgi:hypothetical protein
MNNLPDSKAGATPCLKRGYAIKNSFNIYTLFFTLLIKSFEYLCILILVNYNDKDYIT